MFEKYVHRPGKFVAIPLPKGKEPLYLSEDGQVFSHTHGQLAIGYDEHGFKTVVADLWQGFTTYKVALVTLVTYGKLKLPTTYYHLVEPFHLDGDKNNGHPANLGYRYSYPIECQREPGYYHIPFFGKYAITREGEVIQWITGKRLRPYITKARKDDPKNTTGGYAFLSMSNDVSPFTIGRHRLLALAFLPYPDTVDRLDVNHIDGVPGNDWISNLEWTTRKRNMDHAYRTGLRSQNVTVHAKNVITGEERTFYAVQDAARALNGHTHIILRRLDDPNQTIYTGGWLFKSDPQIPWRHVKNPQAELKRLSTATKVLSKNVFTGTIRQHESINRVGHDLELDVVQAPKTQILKGYQRPYCGYLFKLVDDDTPWPEFNERELAVFRDNPRGHARGVIARPEFGEELFFTNIDQAADHFQHTLKSKNDVIKAIARMRVVEGHRLFYL